MRWVSNRHVLKSGLEGSQMSKLRRKGPSPAMVVALVALIVALGGTAYAAQSINAGAVKKQTIGSGKLKQKTLTGFQINPNNLVVPPAAQPASPPHWAVVNNPPSPGNAALARATDEAISPSERTGAFTA